MTNRSKGESPKKKPRRMSVKHLISEIGETVKALKDWELVMFEVGDLRARFHDATLRARPMSEKDAADYTSTLGKLRQNEEAVIDHLSSLSAMCLSLRDVFVRDKVTDQEIDWTKW
jgi:hypothetical protein